MKVVDFGIAKAADSTSMTRTGVLKGKFAYMAPEHADGRSIDHRIDIFAIGLTMYELLTGTNPIRRDSESGTLRAAMECNIPPLSDAAPVPGELDSIVMRALSKRPDDRYTSAREFATALEEFLVSRRWIVGMAQISEMMFTLFPDRPTPKTVPAAPGTPLDRPPARDDRP